MNSYRCLLEEIYLGMGVGEELAVSRAVFTEAYPVGWFDIYNTHEQKFLSSMVGSAWGVWRVYVEPATLTRIISHHEPMPTRVYTDPDRRHLYKRMPDGTLEYIYNLKE